MIAVTVLTSMDQSVAPLASNARCSTRSPALARMTRRRPQESWPAQETPAIRKACDRTSDSHPGIRGHPQVRSATTITNDGTAEAIRAGASYIVVGLIIASRIRRRGGSDRRGNTKIRRFVGS
jgi:hypothetical protein